MKQKTFLITSICASATALHAMDTPFEQAQKLRTTVTERTLRDQRPLAGEEGSALFHHIDESETQSHSEHSRLWLNVHRRLAWDRLQTEFKIDAQSSLIVHASAQEIAEALVHAAQQIHACAHDPSTNRKGLTRLIITWWDAYHATGGFCAQRPELINVQKQPAVIDAKKTVDETFNQLAEKKPSGWFKKTCAILGPVAITILVALLYKSHGKKTVLPREKNT